MFSDQPLSELIVVHQDEILTAQVFHTRALLS
jgi:hypothetical protein